MGLGYCMIQHYQISQTNSRSSPRKASVLHAKVDWLFSAFLEIVNFGGHHRITARSVFSKVLILTSLLFRY